MHLKFRTSPFNWKLIVPPSFYFVLFFFPQEKHKQLRIALKEKEVKEKERREQIEKQKQREIEERKRWAEFEAFI